MGGSTPRCLRQNRPNPSHCDSASTPAPRPIDSCTALATCLTPSSAASFSPFSCSSRSVRFQEAAEHWRAYLRFDADSEWADYAQYRLEETV